MFAILSLGNLASACKLPRNVSNANYYLDLLVKLALMLAGSLAMLGIAAFYNKSPNRFVAPIIAASFIGLLQPFIFLGIGVGDCGTSSMTVQVVCLAVAFGVMLTKARPHQSA